MSGPSAVTVVVPVWDDYVPLLPKAVESVRRNAPEAPIIIVDNASATAVPQLAGCTVVRANERVSAGGARNLGLEQVGTEYVVFLDADDMLLEGTLAFLSRSAVISAPTVWKASTHESVRNNPSSQLTGGRRFGTRMHIVAHAGTAFRDRMHIVALAMCLLVVSGCFGRSRHVRRLPARTPSRQRAPTPSLAGVQTNRSRCTVGS